MCLADLFTYTAFIDGGPSLDKAGLIGRLLTLLAQAGHASNADLPALQDAVMRREQLGSTGIGKGLAIPHATHASVQRPLGILAVCRPPVEFDALDGEPVDIIALILSPPNRPGQHLGEASRGSEGMVRRLADESFCRRLRQAESAEEVTDLVRSEGGMTRSEWLACNDPQLMLESLAGVASERKLRLFAAACCRMIWHLLEDDRSRAAVEIAERHADGLATDEQLSAVNALAEAAFMTSSGPGPVGAVASATTLAASAVWGATASRSEGSVWTPDTPLVGMAINTALQSADAEEPERQGEARQAQAALVRDLFGDRGRPVAVDPRWLSPAAVSVARAIYESGDFGSMPVLADALIDAGCGDEELLGHLRQPGFHWRGCHALDAILGKG